MSDHHTDEITPPERTTGPIPSNVSKPPTAATSERIGNGEMADLKVSYDWLSQSASNLKSIQNELQNTSEHQKDVKGSLGSGDIAHAMSDFADNWDNHRRKILDKVQALGEMSEKTMEAFTDVDTKLKNGLDGQGKK